MASISLYDTNNFKTDLFNLQIGSQQVIPHRIEVDPGVMAMNGYPTLYKASKLELNHLMQFSVILKIPPLWGGKECDWRILRPNIRAVKFYISLGW